MVADTVVVVHQIDFGQFGTLFVAALVAWLLVGAMAAAGRSIMEDR